jgi:hypothetical protein
MTFHAENQSEDTSYQIMKLSDYGVWIVGNASVQGTLVVEVMTSPSDSRLKKEVNPIDQSVEKIMLITT